MSSLSEHLHGLNKSREKNRGGYRPNSGRKKGIETKVINFRIPTDKEQEFRKLVEPIVKEIRK